MVFYESWAVSLTNGEVKTGQRFPFFDVAGTGLVGGWGGTVVTLCAGAAADFAQLHGQVPGGGRGGAAGRAEGPARAPTQSRSPLNIARAEGIITRPIIGRSLRIVCRQFSPCNNPGSF